jgi:hypothetical protein
VRHAPATPCIAHRVNPLGSVGSGDHTSQQACFALCHENEPFRLATLGTHVAMQNTTNKDVICNTD